MTDKANSKPAIIIAIIGVVGTIVVAIINKCNFSPEQPKEEAISTQINADKQPSNATPIDTSLTSDTLKVDPAKLTDIIREQQQQAVRISYSETDCFTVLTLIILKRAKT
jgi:hypothetical protein